MAETKLAISLENDLNGDVSSLTTLLKLKFVPVKAFPIEPSLVGSSKFIKS